MDSTPNDSPQLNPREAARGFVRPDVTFPRPSDIANQPEGPTPTVMERLNAGLWLQNPVTAAVYGATNPDDTPLPGYNPLTDEDLTDYDPMMFIDSNNPATTKFIKDEVDQEQRWRDTAGGWGEAFGAISNPLLWAGGAAIAPLKLGVVGTALAEAGIETGSEIILQKQQRSRTLTETAINVASAYGVTHMLGAAIQGVSNRQLKVLTKQFEDDIKSDMGIVTDVGEVWTRWERGTATPEEIQSLAASEKEALLELVTDPKFEGDAAKAEELNGILESMKEELPIDEAVIGGADAGAAAAVKTTLEQQVADSPEL